MGAGRTQGAIRVGEGESLLMIRPGVRIRALIRAIGNVIASDCEPL